MELHDKQSGKPSVQVPLDQMWPRVMSIFDRSISSSFLAIAIDFGTVFSNVSYAVSAGGGSIHDIAGYPGFQSGHGDATQVPTIVDLTTGSWGYQVKPNMEKRIKWLKLLLLNEDEIQYDEIRNWRIREGRRLQELGTTAVVEGDSFVVCDAGGSSVYVITYLIKSTVPFRVKECVMGSGEYFSP
ncbi:hypothetical protein LRP88_13941 [Fusarium phalaenopsidis]